MTRARFKNVILKDADFTGALPIPKEIKEKLANGRYMGEGLVTTGQDVVSYKNIFFSMPSVMEKSEELLTKDFKSFLESKGYNVHYYIRDDYPCYVQFF